LLDWNLRTTPTPEKCKATAPSAATIHFVLRMQPSRKKRRAAAAAPLIAFLGVVRFFLVLFGFLVLF